MSAQYRRVLHLSAPLPIGINTYAKDLSVQVASAHGEYRTIKEGVAYNIVVDLIKSGELYPGAIAIDASSGGTGRGYAGILQPLGIKLRLIVSASLPPGKLTGLRVYGEGVEVIPHAGPESTVARARREAKEFGYVLLDQYARDTNPQWHAENTAPCLWELANGEVDVVFIAMGTCGTLIGFSRFLRRVSPNVIIIGIATDPNQKVPQIPGMRTPDEIERDVLLKYKDALDEMLLAQRSEAVRGSRLLAYAEPSWPGLSTGASLSQAIPYLGKHLGRFRGKRAFIVSHDSIEPYLDIMNAEQDDANINRASENRPAFMPVAESFSRQGTLGFESAS